MIIYFFSDVELFIESQSLGKCTSPNNQLRRTKFMKLINFQDE